MTKQMLMAGPSQWVDQVENQHLAGQQWAALRNLLVEKGVDVIVASTGETALIGKNGLLYKNKFIAGRSSNEADAQNELNTTNWFLSHGFDVCDAPELMSRKQVNFDGRDIVVDQVLKNVWFGFNFKSSLGFKHILDQAFEETDLMIRGLELVDDNFQTLDTCFCVLPNGGLLWYPPAFSEYSQYVIDMWYGDRAFAIDEKDALRNACNTIAFGNHLVMPMVSSKLVERMRSRGYDVSEINTSMFMDNGGCKSLTLAINA